MLSYRVYKTKYNGNAGTVFARRQEKVTFGMGETRWYESGARVAWDHSKDIDENHKDAVRAAIDKGLVHLSGIVRDIHYGGEDANGLLWVVVVER